MHGPAPRCTAALAAPALLLALGLLAPTPGACLPLLLAATPADPVAPLVAALTLLAWVGASWLTAVTMLLVVLHGRTTRTARAVNALAPRALRLGVTAALGASLVLGSAGTAGAQEPRAQELGALQLDWPTAAAPPAPARPRPAPAPTTGGPSSPAVVVAAGDSLWALASTHLGPGATDRAVAQEWPAWWQANRDAIGEDPDLLRPGTRLVPPTR